jgi:hypothetical protein
MRLPLGFNLLLGLRQGSLVELRRQSFCPGDALGVAGRLDPL